MVPRRHRRGWLATALQLYSRPGAALSAVRKAAAVMRRRGLAGLIRASALKLGTPNLPLALLDGSQAMRAVSFEDRWVDVDRSLAQERSVTCIILTHGNQALVDRCVESLSRSISPKARFDVVVVSNGGAVRLAENLHFPVRQDAETRPFNWSSFNNRAAMAATGEFLLFLNDDVEALHHGWLEAMLAEAVTPAVGAVGAKLLYPNGLIQHIGVELGLGGEAGHVDKFQRRAYPGPGGRYLGPFDVAAVTGACLLTRQAVFAALGGFDERFPLSYNDVDYCLRVRESGLRVVLVPHAELLHHETLTRRLGGSRVEAARFRARWGHHLH